MTPFASSAVEQAFAAYPTDIRKRLLALRALIFDTAASIPEVGPIEETLKWGEPAYLTAQTRIGSTVRIGWKKAHPRRVAMYFHCRTSLVATFRTLFPGQFLFEGNRAIVFELAEPIATDALAFCIGAALTYHRDKAAGIPVGDTVAVSLRPARP